MAPTSATTPAPTLAPTNPGDTYAPTIAPVTAPSSVTITTSDPCFAKDSTTACKLLDARTPPDAAYAASYGKTAGGAAARVLMATLAVGDSVLTATPGGDLGTTRVVVNHHASADHAAKMLTLTTADGAKLSVTPEIGRASCRERV